MVFKFQIRGSEIFFKTKDQSADEIPSLIEKLSVILISFIYFMDTDAFIKTGKEPFISIIKDDR
jgi:hypothetical protein